MTYLSQETAPKAKTGPGDIAQGSISIEHLSPGLFLELQKVALHTHEGQVSSILPANATPEVIRGYNTYERVEHYTVTWTGDAASSASVALTFGTEFGEAPTVVAIATGRSGADVKVTTSTVTTTGCTLYWKIDSGTVTEVKINVLVIGR